MTDNTFAAAPKVVKPKKKFREPAEEEEEEQETKFTYQNLMWNRRVERGNTYAAIVTSKNVEIPHKNTFKPKPAYFKPEQTNDSYNAAGGTRRANIEIFTDEFVETLTDKPPRYEKDCQTEFVIEKPIVRLYMKVPTGVDRETQIWDDDLFDFDYEVEPLLRVLCGKTLEHAKLEVLQEEELRIMKERQNELHNMNKEEQQSIQAMEEKEIRLKEQNDQKISALRQKKEIQRNCHKRLVSRVAAKHFMKFIKPNTMAAMQANGLFRDAVESKLIEQLLPILYSQTEAELAGVSTLKTGTAEILNEVESDLKKAHRLAVEAEHTRRSLILADRKQREREKTERKLMNAEEKYMLKYLSDLKVARTANQYAEQKEEEEKRLAAEREGQQPAVDSP